MLSSIHPFGERSRNSRWWVTVTAYVVGSVAGGASTGAAFGLAGQVGLDWISATTALMVLAVAAGVGALVDLGWLPVGPPGPHRQVNERWLMAYRGWVYGLGFGYQLGLGLATIVTTMTVWLTWLAAALSASWVTGTAIGAVFGLARSLFIFAGRHVESPDALRRLHRTIADQAAAIHRMTVTTGVLAAATALTLGVTT